MLKRDGNVYTQVVKNCKAKTLSPTLREFNQLNQSTIYSDLPGLMMNWLIMDQKEHCRVKHCQSKFANGKNHINGIENIFHSLHSFIWQEWVIQNIGFQNFKGISKENFYLHSKV